MKQLSQRLLGRHRAWIVKSEKPDDVQITFSFGEGTSIRFPDEGLTTCAIVTRLNEWFYRLESIPFGSEAASFGDVIEAESLPDASLRFRRVVQPSGYRLYSFLLPKEERDSEELQQVLLKVDGLGGHWERVFGGVLLICLPPDVEWDPTPEVLG